MASSIPLLFTLPPSNRHEVILVDTISKLSLKCLNQQIVAAMEGSPNCKEFMAQYSPTAGLPRTIEELRIHWAASGRDRKAWPEYTVVTERNWPAVLEMLRVGGGIGKDVLEVRVGVEGEGEGEGE
ncbi:uncharacterized protein EI97DRAFT_465002 [Westerdykella ornata]|uniref:Uncharacterized protein n=1 Tax=Westerdykella ornata TaxID=318751 RepID=A0A6A6JUA3_WESOR|nr:uncharacterized protein EI97DRAFT_465002 [Westerdykella ornata]KAF2279825.1 hypothetical protein EI97DRAFT_465002 [Westerdykella ornata]